ncbi:hypothetical protein [Nocardia xishanensis]
MITGDTDGMTEAIDVAATRVTATIAGIRAHAPDARILTLDYFEVVGTTGHDSCRPRACAGWKGWCCSPAPRSAPPRRSFPTN